MRDVAVTALGKDRPGIVAAVTKVFFELGCNLADCSMSRLAGQFAMILLVQAPDELGVEALERALHRPAADLGLALNVQEIAHDEAEASERPYVISLYGADHPGIVYRITELLAGRSVNVTDLVSRVVGENVYAMVLDVDLPNDLDEHALEADLAQVARDVGVEMTLRPAEIAEL